MTESIACKHGQLRRQCEICDLGSDLDAAETRIAKLEAFVRRVAAFRIYGLFGDAEDKVAGLRQDAEVLVAAAPDVCRTGPAVTVECRCVDYFGVAKNACPDCGGTGRTPTTRSEAAKDMRRKAGKRTPRMLVPEPVVWTPRMLAIRPFLAGIWEEAMRPSVWANIDRSSWSWFKVGRP